LAVANLYFIFLARAFVGEENVHSSPKNAPPCVESFLHRHFMR